MNNKEKILVQVSAKIDQSKASAKEGLRLLVKDGGPTAIFLHLNFLGIQAKSGSIQELPGVVVNILKHLAYIATVELLMENEGEFLEEIFGITGDGPASPEIR